MSQLNIQLNTLLKKHGYSSTKQRQTLFDVLAGQEPMSMRELSERAAPNMDRASVYRTVALFEQIGVTRRINIGWKYKIELSDVFAEHHHHLSCLKCKRIVPINKHELEAFIDKLAAENNFQPVDHEIEIQGYCSSCRREEA